MVFQPNQPPVPPNTLTGGVVVRPPPRYFEFASPTDKVAAHRNGISAERIRELVRQHGNNIVIGFDMGKTLFDPARRGVYTHEQALAQTALSQNRAMLEAFNTAKQLGVRLHAYLGGPGGPTGSSITDDEMAHMRRAAGLVGINTGNDNWMNQWNDWGWKKAAQEQLKVVKQLGFESYELDNLERDARIKAPRNADTAMDTRALVAFYAEAAKWDGPQRLMMKNLDVENLQGVERAMNDGTLHRNRFADFHISEETFRGNWSAIERASARMGIQLSRSNDTYAYATSQAFPPSLESEMMRLSNLHTQIANAQRQDSWRVNAQAFPPAPPAADGSATPPAQTARADQAQSSPFKMNRISS